MIIGEDCAIGAERLLCGNYFNAYVFSFEQNGLTAFLQGRQLRNTMRDFITF